ncbi:MAG: serine--tRNA ligase [bacterium]
MLDPKMVREDPKAVKEALKKRGADTAIVDEFIQLDAEWRKALFEVDKMKSQRNEVSDQVAVMKKDKKDASQIILEMRKLSEEIKISEEHLTPIEEKVRYTSLMIPNIPHASVPEGKCAADNKEVRKSGVIRTFSFTPKAHFDVGKDLDILDFTEAAKISGARFVVYKGLGAALEQALISFMLDLQANENGYTQIWPPLLVLADSLIGTGQLPKFEQDLFKTTDDFYLIPTAEVPLVNLHREEIIPLDKLPLKYCAYTPCFRKEAGTYGKDTRGIIRQHQFNKIELVKFTSPKTSYAELESLVKDASKVFELLKLPYRVVELCTADLGFASSKTYDLEVWFPSENRYREVSSCSNCEEFQSRRANIRYRKDQKSKPEYVHTLNGSGVAVGRTFAAILENYQQDDGSVVVPEVLRPYMRGIERIVGVV